MNQRRYRPWSHPSKRPSPADAGSNLPRRADEAMLGRCDDRYHRSSYQQCHDRMEDCLLRMNRSHPGLCSRFELLPQSGPLPPSSPRSGHAPPLLTRNSAISHLPAVARRRIRLGRPKQQDPLPCSRQPVQPTGDGERCAAQSACQASAYHPTYCPPKLVLDRRQGHRRQSVFLHKTRIGGGRITKNKIPAARSMRTIQAALEPARYRPGIFPYWSHILSLNPPTEFVLGRSS